MTGLLSKSRTRIAAVAAVLVLAALVVGVGPVAAHNPACHQTAGADGPHYDDDPGTGSETAYEKNPTLGGDFPENAAGGCTVGNSQSPHGDDEQNDE